MTTSKMPRLPFALLALFALLLLTPLGLKAETKTGSEQSVNIPGQKPGTPLKVNGANTIPLDPAKLSVDFSDRTTVFAGGRIVSGGKSVGGTYGGINLKCAGIEGSIAGYEMFDFGEGGLKAAGFIRSSRTNSLTENSCVYTADVRSFSTNEKKIGTYRFSIARMDNGLVKVEARLVLDDPAVLKQRYFILHLPVGRDASGVYIETGITNVFSVKNDIAFSGKDLAGLKIIYFPQAVERERFSIQPLQCSSMRLAKGDLSITPDENGVMSFLIDISGGQKMTLEKEFWDCDRQHLPDYGASSNLVQNPSFEEGLRYWAYRTFSGGAMPLQYKNIYELDTTVAHTGQNSLRIRALGINTTLPLGNTPVLCDSEENYTLSFYAKSSAADGLSLNVHGRGARHHQPFGPITNRSSEVGTFAVGNDWQRYSFSFTCLENFLTIYYTARTIGVRTQAEEYIWLDDVQIEKNGITEFKQAPCAMQLTSAARGNFLEYGKRPGFQLAIRSEPNTAGTVVLSVEDFFFKTIFEKELRFKTDTAGKALISLSALDDKVVGDKLRGVFSASATLKMEGNDRPYRDYFRFSVMNFLENKHKNKDIFGLLYAFSITAGGPDFERFLVQQRAEGFGSQCGDLIGYGQYIDPEREQERIALMERYGINTMGRCVIGMDGKIYEPQGDLKMTDIKTKINPTVAELAEYERICEIRARLNPSQKMWWMYGESSAGCQPLESHPEAFAKFNIATFRGIKKGNPSAKVLVEGGPWTIATNAGLLWTQRYIQDARKIDPTVKFDGAAGHYYCDIPETYDLDENIDQYIKMLDRNGCADWPIYLNEGGNYCPMNCPSMGLNPYIAHSGNGMYLAPFTYHMGRAERTSAALIARSWLVALKYQSRVKHMGDHMTHGRYLDIDFTARAFDKIPNTLGRILGDASFYKDIRFAPFCRCYVFKDDKTGAPIALVWGYKDAVERWKEEPPKYKFDFGMQALDFIDLMENEVGFTKDADGFTVIPISQFPLFIKGAPGAEQKLCDAIAASVPLAGSGGGVEISAFPNSDGKAAVVFASKVSREYSGNAKVVINGVENKWALNIPALGSREERVALPRAAEYGKLQKFAAEYAFAGEDAGKIAGNYILLKDQAGITVDGDLTDWKDLPVNDLGAGISMQAVVADKKAIMAIRVTGKNLAAEDVFAGVGLYVDPFEKTDTWAEPKTVAGGAVGDLGIYEIQKSKDGGLEALCRFSQGMLAGMDKDLMVVGKVQKLIKVRTAMSGDAACLEIEVPEKIFAPLLLGPGSRFGLNISVPLKEGGIATLAPIAGYVSVSEPVKINFVMVVIGK